VSSPDSNDKPSRVGRDMAFIYRYLQPYRGLFFSAILVSSISMLFGLMFPYLVGHLLDAAYPPVPSAGQTWNLTINQVALILLGTLVIQAVAMFFSAFWFRKVGESSVVTMRRDLFARLVSMPMSFFGEHRAGELSSRLSNDLMVIQETLSDVVPQIIRQFALLAGGVIFIAVTSIKLSLVMISSFPVLILLAAIFGRRIRKQARMAQDRLAESATVVDEAFQGIANVKAFANEWVETGRYSTALATYLTTSLKAARLRSGLISFIIIGIFGSVILVLWYGARLMQAGELTQGELTRFILYTAFVGGAVASFAEVFSHLQKTLGATERVQELLHQQGEEVVAPTRDAPELPRGDVEFRNVHFRYPSRPDAEVLRGISLYAKAGEKIAIVGPSGAGKSTIASLILRFYEPTEGQILFDGRDSRSLPLGAVRGSAALVPQEVLLFGSSIRENIAYGKPGASDEEIYEASRRANCHEFIMRFPDGYDTLVGDRGVKLSGGQRQRIAIARALLKDPAILILDEATSSLDSESEKLIQEALDTLMEGRTSFIIAHRLSTVRHVDRIYVIDQGTVAEWGTHDELIAREDGIYRRLCELQLAGEP